MVIGTFVHPAPAVADPAPAYPLKESTAWLAPANLVVSNNRLFFTAGTESGNELWTSDGTVAGTHLVKDINLGSASANPAGLVVDGNWVYFAADDGIHGTELWRSDGSDTGTVLVDDILPGAGSSVPHGIIAYDGIVLFAADDGTTGEELWSSDGSPAGTRRIQDIWPGSAGSSPTNLTVVDDTVFFEALASSSQESIWTTDGTPSGTRHVVDLPSLGPPPWRMSPDPGHFIASRRLLFFAAWDPTFGDELWRSDGTAAGTFPLSNESPGYSGVYELTAAAGNVYFVATTNTGSGPWSAGLWRTDGTVTNTARVTGFWDNHGGELRPLGSTLYFAMDDYWHGTELWKTDGTESGTMLVKDISPGNTPSSPFGLADVGARLAFQADDGVHGSEPFTSDGTTLGTVLLADVGPDASTSNPRSFVAASNRLYFIAGDGTHSETPWAAPITNDMPPDTSILQHPSSVAPDSATFSFAGIDDHGQTTTSCSLDHAGFSACLSPITYTNLSSGNHTFAVQARDSSGQVDPSPATDRWVVGTPDSSPPSVRLLTVPRDPAAQGTAAFTWANDDPDGTSGIQNVCTLDDATSTCTSPAEYSGLADGHHRFVLAAADAAGNVSTPVTFDWRVDTTPPTTQITTGPPDPSDSSTATFSFSASDPDDTALTFTCTLDGTSSTCDQGVTYSGITDGLHDFSVTASDPAGNISLPADEHWHVDTTPPASRFLTEDRSVILPGDRISGMTTDDGVGVDDTIATFTPLFGPPTTVPASLMCSNARRMCKWWSESPSVPGVYVVSVRATDRAGNMEDPGPSPLHVVVLRIPE